MNLTELEQICAAFDRLATAGFAMGPEWQAVHQICQDHEGEPLFDWGHALCHRIEGDDWNAGYWYRRAGKPVFEGSLEREWAEMRSALTAQSR